MFSAFYWNWLLYGLIVYLIVNLALTGNMGFWFYYRVKASLTEMRARIYGYLTDSDYVVYAYDPLKTAFEKFRGHVFLDRVMLPGDHRTGIACTSTSGQHYHSALVPGNKLLSGLLLLQTAR